LGTLLTGTLALLSPEGDFYTGFGTPAGKDDLLLWVASVFLLPA